MANIIPLKVTRTGTQATGFAELQAGDVVDPSVLPPFAPLASPALTGTPTAPTPAGGDNSTNLATTEFVQGAIPPVASEADAQAGTDNAKMMTALAVAEAIAALAPRVANWTSPNRLIDAHAGWKLGDIIYDEGLGGQQVATVTVNSGFPGDGNDHDIEFYFYDTDQAGTSFASGSLYTHYGKRRH